MRHSRLAAKISPAQAACIVSLDRKGRKNVTRGASSRKTLYSRRLPGLVWEFLRGLSKLFSRSVRYNVPAARCWEVVQSAVHQTLNLIILVRVQASQPIFLSPRKTTTYSSSASGLPWWATDQSAPAKGKSSDAPKVSYDFCQGCRLIADRDKVACSDKAQLWLEPLSGPSDRACLKHSEPPRSPSVQS
jgi:hypothetical protein